MTIVDQSNQLKASRLNILVVLTDMPMPLMDGYQAIKKLRSKKKTPYLLALLRALFRKIDRSTQAQVVLILSEKYSQRMYYLKK